MNEDSFDFQSVSQEEEQLDFNKLIPCPHCKKPIPYDATLCYYCGQEASHGKRPLWIVWTAIILVAIFVTFILLY